MGLSERIIKLGDVFETFTITSNMCYVIIRMSEKNVVPQDINKRFDGITYEVKNGGVWFCTRSYMDIDKLFDAVDYVLEYNAEIEQKIELYSVALKNLKKIFNSEKVEKLKTLEFKFGEMLTEGENVEESVDSENAYISQVFPNETAEEEENVEDNTARKTRKRKRNNDISEQVINTESKEISE